MIHRESQNVKTYWENVTECTYSLEIVILSEEKNFDACHITINDNVVPSLKVTDK